ncbi:MAG: helix-turn-helix domain-containing protein [Erysipelotrichaceae bacterium]|nr:helix-turn-helix domain-containing protein [Erysipelotrichaceae bacterium]
MINAAINYSFLGQTIKHIRQKSNITQNELAEGICSRRTVISIEKGNHSSIPNIYSMFSKKLGLLFDECDIEVQEKILTFQNNIINAFSEDCLVEKFFVLRNQIRDFQQYLENTLYYNEILMLYDAYLTFYIEGSLFNVSFYQYLDKVYKTLKGYDYAFSLSLLFNASRKGLITFKNVYHYHALLANEEIFKNYYDVSSVNIGIHCSLIDKEYSPIYENRKTNALWKSFFYRYQIMDSLARAWGNMLDSKGSIQLLKELLEIKDEGNKIIIGKAARDYLPKHILYAKIRSMAICFYRLDDYKNCARMFWLIPADENYRGTANYAFWIDSLQKLNDKDGIIKALKEADPLSSTLAYGRHVIQYYRNKYLNGKTDDELEDYLIRYLKPIHTDSPIYHPIFLEEMKCLVNKTRHYEKLNRYLN